MSLTCTRCGGSGFLNIEQVDESILKIFEASGQHTVILCWMDANEEHDVQVCDCCGNGASWHRVPGEHSAADYGPNGPYAYNGGLPECY